jgi:hypothetical protein
MCYCSVVDKYDFKVTDEFVAVYESLDDSLAVEVDQAILRLMSDHSGAWARQGRVSGENGQAWIIEIRTTDCDMSLYWDYLDGELILLILLIIQPA